MKKLAMALGAALVVAGIAAMHLRQQLHSQREQNTTAMVRVTVLESANSMSSVAQSVAAGVQAATLNPVTAAQPEPAPAAPAARDQSAARNDNPMRAQVEQLMNNPQFMEMQRVMMRQMLEQEFPDVAKDFNLSKDKAGKLLDLLAKQRMDMVADSMGEQRGGKQDRAAREERARARAEKERAFEADLKSLLGDKYEKWDEYEDAALQRQQEEHASMGREALRHAIAAGGAPLPDSQFERLNAAITAEQKRIDGESSATTLKQQMQRVPEINRRLVEAAAPHLNPQQLDRYKLYLEEQREMMSSMGAMGVFPDD